MRILIATAGVLPPSPVADLVERFGGGDGEVSVLSVIEVPRSFLDSLSAEEWRPFEEDPNDRVAARESAVARYVAERGRRLTEPVVAALRSRGLTTAALYVEGSDPAAAIVDTANRIDAGLIVIGATRPIFADGSWGSVSADVMRNSRRPLLLVPGASRDSEDATERPFVADPA